MTEVNEAVLPLILFNSPEPALSKHAPGKICFLYYPPAPPSGKNFTFSRRGIS